MQDDLVLKQQTAPVQPPFIEKTPVIPSSVQPPMTPTMAGGAGAATAPTIRTRRTPQLRLPFDIQSVGSIAFVVAVGAGIWWIDGFFTLQFVNGPSNWLHQAINTFQWLLPWGVTVGTLYLWPSGAKRERIRKLKDQWFDDKLESSYQRYARARKGLVIGVLFWLGLLLFNIGTSTTGVVIWGAGREIGLFGGFTLPPEGTLLRVSAAIVGAIGAFAPEQLLKWAETEWNMR